MDIEQKLQDIAYKLGFDLFGISSADLSGSYGHLEEWLKKGYQGEMKYMENPLRREVSAVVPFARSVLSLGMYYLSEKPAEKEGPEQGQISCYAWGSVDYHSFIKEKLNLLAGAVEKETGSLCKVAVDSFPIQERAYARQAGLGWIGKNTCLIHSKGGSYFFLGEIITSAQLKPDIPAPDRCGTCQACIHACPTGALVAPFQLDARLCISYLTIEYRGRISEDLSRKMENWIFGCDICQAVCPWNRKPKYSRHKEFSPREISWELRELNLQVEQSFKKLFSSTALSRARKKGILRNLLISMENSKGDYNDIFIKASQSEDDVLRYHAQRAWNAHERIKG